MSTPEALMLPVLFHGERRSVMRASRTAAKAFLRGARLDDVVDELAPWSQRPGCIVVDGVEPGEHYYGYMLTAALFKQDRFRDRHEQDRFFVQMIERPWAILGCLGEDSYNLFDDPSRRPIPGRAEEFVGTVARHWTILNQPGPRYLLGTNPGWFWPNAHMVWYALRVMGIPSDEVPNRDPMYASGGIPPILARYVGAR